MIRLVRNQAGLFPVKNRELVRFCDKCWKVGKPCNSIDHLNLVNTLRYRLRDLGLETVSEAAHIPDYLLLGSNIGPKRIADLRAAVTAWVKLMRSGSSQI